MEKTNVQMLYEIINDFIVQTEMPIFELFGVFEIIKAEQGQFLIPDKEIDDEETE